MANVYERNKLAERLRIPFLPISHLSDPRCSALMHLNALTDDAINAEIPRDSEISHREFAIAKLLVSPFLPIEAKSVIHRKFPAGISVEFAKSILSAMLAYSARFDTSRDKIDRNKSAYVASCVASQFASWGGTWATREREEATEIPARLWASHATRSQLLVATLRTLVSFRRVRDVRLQRRSDVRVHVLTFRRRSLTVQTRLA